MINVSGFKVYSTELDEELFKHPDVAIAAAVGIPDPKTPGSERVKIYIKPKPGGEEKLTAEEIIKFCKSVENHGKELLALHQAYNLKPSQELLDLIETHRKMQEQAET